MMRETCVLTVPISTNSASAISALLRPAARAVSTSLSRAVRSTTAAATLAGRRRANSWITRRVTAGETRPSPEAAAGGRRTHRRGEPAGVGVLEQEPRRAVLQGAEDVLVEVEGRDHHDRDGVLDAGAGQPRGRRKAVAARHPNVHQHDIGTRRSRPFHGLATVGCLGHDPDVALRLEEATQGAADGGLVVGEEHADHDVFSVTSEASAPARLGSSNATTQSPCGSAPAVSEPSRRAARSAAPISP